MTNLRAENHALRAELSAQQQQLMDASMAARAVGGRHSRHGAAAFLSNKKNEDDTFDVEAAVLTGAPASRPCLPSPALEPLKHAYHACSNCL